MLRNSLVTKTPASCIRLPEWILGPYSWLQLPVHTYPVGQQMMVQVTGFWPSTWETWNVIPALWHRPALLLALENEPGTCELSLYWSLLKLIDPKCYIVFFVFIFCFSLEISFHTLPTLGLYWFCMYCLMNDKYCLMILYIFICLHHVLLTTTS